MQTPPPADKTGTIGRLLLRHTYGTAGASAGDDNPIRAVGAAGAPCRGPFDTLSADAPRASGARAFSPLGFSPLGSLGLTAWQPREASPLSFETSVGEPQRCGLALTPEWSFFARLRLPIRLDDTSATPVLQLVAGEDCVHLQLRQLLGGPPPDSNHGAGVCRTCASST